MTATITPLNVVPLAAAEAPVAAPAVSLPALVTRPAVDEIARTRDQITALSTIGREVRMFEHTKSAARHWWAPVTVGALGVAAATVSVEAAVIIASAGAAIGGAMRAWLPIVTRRVQAEEVSATQSLTTVPADEKDVALSPSDISAATRAASIIADMQARKINDPQTLARLEAIVARGAPATDAEKARSLAWETVLDAGQTYRGHDTGKAFFEALNGLSNEDRAALAPAAYDQLFVARVHSQLSYSHMAQVFKNLRAEIGTPYPAPSVGAPSPAGTDSKDAVKAALRQLYPVASRDWKRETLSAEAITKIVAGKPVETVPGDYAVFAHVLSPERTSLERATLGEMASRLNTGYDTNLFERDAGIAALIAMGQAQPQEVRDEALRILAAFDTLSDGALSPGTRDLRPAMRMFDKLDAANELGLRELFALR